MSDFANKVVYAGDTPLLNLFKDGAVVVLRSKASGKTIRVKPDGEVDAEGYEGSWAQFFVHVRGDGVVALQNVEHPANWLGIKNDKLFLGRGGPFTEFKIEERDEAVTFESVKFPGQRIGFLPNGEVKPPENTGQGQHGQFVPKVVGERDELIVPGKTPLLMKFGHGNIITLESKAYGKNVRVDPHGVVDGNGGDGKWAQFVVHVRGENKVAFQNVDDPDHWLAIRRDTLTGKGKGGKFTEFKIEEHDGFAVFESVACPGLHVGIKPDGEAKPPSNTGTGGHARFSPKVVEEQPQYNRVGDSAVMRTLTHLNTVVLYSKASGKTIRIKPDGEVDGEGHEGDWAQLIVHVICPGVVTLQNVRDPKLYLKPKNDKLKTGGGGKGCQLKVHEVDDFLVFESVMHPGQHVGILPNGNAKPPNNTGQGQHGRFTPKVKDRSPLLLSLAGRSKLKRRFIDFDKILLKSDASEKFLRIRDGKVEGTAGTGQLAQFVVLVRSSGVVSLQNVHDPNLFVAIKDDELIAGNGNVNSQFIVDEVDDTYVALESQICENLRVGIVDDGSPKKPSNTGKGRHGRFAPQPNKVAYAGDTPLLNLFKDGAVVVLRSMASGKTIRVKPEGEVDGKGGEGSWAQFFVHVRRDGVVALQNVEHPANWLGIKNDELFLGNGDPFTEFKVEKGGECDGVVTFESVKSPGQRIGILPNGEVKPLERNDQGEDVQFVPKIVGERDELIVPGKTPLLMKFGHGNIITLESKATEKNLRIDNHGTVNGNGGSGKWAQFIVHVRGENKVAFQNVNDPDHWLAIHGDTLSGTSECGSDTEFKIEEHGDSAVFESVDRPGLHVGIKPDGEAEPPSNTGTGEHAWFSPKVIKEQPQYNRVGDSTFKRALTHLNTVVLYSKTSEKTIRIKPDAQLIVHVICPGVVTLQNVRDPKLYLKAEECKLTTGGGGKGCQFKVHEVDDFLVFESVSNPGQHVGILPNGNARSPNSTGQEPQDMFTPKVKDRSPLLLSLAGRSKLKRQFIDFDKILLKSDASEKFLRIRADGNVEGTGETDQQAQFVVLVRSSGVVSLQNVEYPNLFVAIEDDELGAGNGNVFSHFIVDEVDDTYVVLETQINEKLRVGIVEDGSPKKPSNTGKGKHGRFAPQPVPGSKAKKEA